MKKVFVLMLLCFSCFIQAALAYEYEVVNLGSGNAYGINEFDQIVGSRNISGSERAVIWDVNMQVEDIGTLGGSWARALDINNLGQIVGTSQIAGSSGLTHAFCWSSNVGIQDLGIQASWSNAYSINDSSEIVGDAYMSYPIGYVRAFIKDNSGGSTQILGSLGDTRSGARNINSSGQVVGSSDGTDGYVHAFFWDGEMQNLETTQSHAYDINDNKVAVGDARISGNNTPAIWDIDSGSVIYLEALAASNACATSINNSGWVVGGANGKAFLWDSSNGARDLIGLIDPASGWTLQLANAINEKGQIVGSGTFNGVSSAFLLNPTRVVPEPVSMLLFGVGGLTLAAARKLRKIK
ncbi:MAG: PEP-CTERM sorting domain-containing protein [Candidatus Omnitrophota bacterium]|jgi:probable HAF family extracellular repeat protein